MTHCTLHCIKPDHFLYTGSVIKNELVISLAQCVSVCVLGKLVISLAQCVSVCARQTERSQNVYLVSVFYRLVRLTDNSHTFS